MKYVNVRIDDVLFDDIYLQKRICELICNIISPTYGMILYKTAENSIVLRDGEGFFANINNAELALHGITHDNYQDKYEFQKWSPSRQKDCEVYLQVGKEIIGSDIFIPPHNYFDRKWANAFAALGYTTISSSKRDFPAIRSSSEYPVGIIRSDNLTFIPQTCFVKREYFYSIDNYFYKLFWRIQQYYKKVDIVVLTIHWWDFIEDGQIDTTFIHAFRSFIEAILQESKEISLNNAKELVTIGSITSDYFLIR